jgi:hypothetical protein
MGNHHVLAQNSKKNSKRSPNFSLTSFLALDMIGKKSCQKEKMAHPFQTVQAPTAIGDHRGLMKDDRLILCISILANFLVKKIIAESCFS